MSSRDSVEMWVTDDEIACAWTPVIKGLLLDEHCGFDFISMLNTWGIARRGTLGCCAQSPAHGIQANAWFHHDAGCWVLRRDQSTSRIFRMKLIWAVFPHLQMHMDLKLPHPAMMLEMCCTIVFTYNLSKSREEATISWSQRSVSCVSCVRDKLMMSTDTLVCIYIFTHMHVKYVRKHVASLRQWHKPSAAVFRLHRALLMQRVPYNATHFHFHPRTAAPPFCSSHLHRSLCTHNM